MALQKFNYKKMEWFFLEKTAFLRVCRLRTNIHPFIRTAFTADYSVSHITIYYLQKFQNQGYG